MAEKREIKSRESFLDLAENVADEGLKHLCLDLAQEEKEHQQKIFHLLLSLEMEQADRPPL